MSAPDDARARDDAADAYDVLVRRVWEAVTGDTHEGPASVDVLLEAVAGLRARADGAEAARDALRAAAREYLAAKTATEAADCEEASCAAASAAAYAYADDAADEAEFELRDRAAEVAWLRRCEAKATAAQARDRHEAAEASLRTLAGEG